jgi:hypothetical protein
MENTEIWKSVPNYEGLYEVSNMGRVKSVERIVEMNGFKKLKKELISIGFKNKKYLAVRLYKNSIQRDFKVHQLVAMAFLGHTPDGTTKIVVDHINDNPKDNRLENLRLLTNRENVSRRGGTSKYVGVCWDKKAKKFKAEIYFNCKKNHLGHFNCETSAHIAYQKALNNYLKQTA